MGKVLRWLELGGEPQREELLLADPAVKYFWRIKENLTIRGGVLKYKWTRTTSYRPSANGQVECYNR